MKAISNSYGHGFVYNCIPRKGRTPRATLLNGRPLMISIIYYQDLFVFDITVILPRGYYYYNKLLCWPIFVCLCNTSWPLFLENAYMKKHISFSANLYFFAIFMNFRLCEVHVHKIQLFIKLEMKDKVQANITHTDNRWQQNFLTPPLPTVTHLNLCVRCICYFLF